MGISIPIGSMYGLYANIEGILMVNVTIYSIHGSYGIVKDPIPLLVDFKIRELPQLDDDFGDHFS